MSYRLKIIISLFSAFLISFLYIKISSTPFISPSKIGEIKNIFSNLSFPNLDINKSFTLNLNQKEKRAKNQNIYFLPTISPTPYQLIKTTPLIPTPINFNQSQPTITYYTQPLPTSRETPQPTKPPKPTPTPPLPPITSSQRPGATLKEIYEEIEKRLCVPAALMYAFQQQETGPWWPVNTSSSKVRIYNKYGWWLDGSGNSCIGMGYHVQTGVVPPDAADAGTICQKPIPSGDDQAIMGLWGISKYEEEKAKKYITNIIKGNIDRRVIFDSAVIFAIITKNRIGNPPKDCSRWPDEVIKIAAEKHHGACKYEYATGNKGDYCQKIIDLYHQY